MEGCDPQVWQAMKDKAQSRVAYDVAVTEEIIKKPDSTLALTCFDQAANQSAVDGGGIFSGDFSAEMGTVVNDALNDLLSNNFLGSLLDDFGFLGGILAGLLGSLFGGGGWSGCSNMQDLWEEIVTMTGIETNVPLLSFQDLLAGNVPGAAAGDPVFDNIAVEAGGGVIAALNASMAALPVPNVPSFAADVTLCDVLNTAGLGPCP